MKDNQFSLHNLCQRGPHATFWTVFSYGHDIPLALSVCMWKPILILFWLQNNNCVFSLHLQKRNLPISFDGSLRIWMTEAGCLKMFSIWANCLNNLLLWTIHWKFAFKECTSFISLHIVLPWYHFFKNKINLSKLDFHRFFLGTLKDSRFFELRRFLESLRIKLRLLIFRFPGYSLIWIPINKVYIKYWIIGIFSFKDNFPP